MRVLPAIDLKDGQCVRLKKGDDGTAHKVAEDAVETARGFLAAGAELIHMVDLDGANMEFAAIDEALQPVREELSMAIHMQRMDIFDAMHRI